jgi:hypothetical protein
MQPGGFMPFVADDLPRLNTRENPWEFFSDSRQYPATFGKRTNSMK